MSNQENHIIVRLRISPELRDKIAESSKTNNRSMSADMAARLEDSFRKEGIDIDVLRDMMDSYNSTCIEFSRKIDEQSKLIERLIQEKQQ